MTAAPVGQHCPICSGRMREETPAAVYRAQQRVAGLPIARMARGASVVKTLMGINLAILIGMYLTGRPTAGDTLLRFGALGPVVHRSEWWRLFTAMFVHIGFLHIVLNLWALLLFGPAMEQRYGRMRFLALYLASGLMGNAFSLAFAPGKISAGASGAIFGILGAWLAFFLRHRSIPALRGQLRSIVFLIGINLVFSVTIPGIDALAHIGGLIAGLVIGAALEFSGASRAGPRRAAWLGVLAFSCAFAGVLAVTHMV